MMGFNMWAYFFFIVDAVAYTPVNVAQYTPVGSLCLVEDVSHAAITRQSAAEMSSTGLDPIAFVVNVSCSATVLGRAISA